MALKKLLAACLAAALWGGGATACFAQIIIERRPSQPQIYDLRIINDLGQPICLKIMGYGTWRSSYVILAPGQTVNKKFYSGTRIVTAWNNTSQELILLSRVNFDRSGSLRIRRSPRTAPNTGETPVEIPEDVASVLAPNMTIEAE